MANLTGLQEEYGPISVIIPCYRCVHTIERALESILTQTVKPLEVIIIHDASDKFTSNQLDQIIVKYQLWDGWINIIHLNCRKGPAGARNTGWAHARQKYLAFLDADDAWHPNKLEIQYHLMQANPHVAISGHQTIWLKQGVSPPPLKQKYHIQKINPVRQLVSNRFHTRSVMLRSNLPFRFDESKHYSEDYLLWLEIIFNGFTAIHFDLPLAYTYKPQYGVAGLSADLWEMEKGELDSYLQLYRKGNIAYTLFASLIGFSFFKYVRRKIASKLIQRQSP